MTDAEPGGGNDGQRDLELIARWKSGDERAATELVERHASALARFAVSSGERNEVDELVQDTFVRAFASIDGFRGESSFRTWLFTIERRCSSIVEGRRSGGAIARRPGQRFGTEFSALDGMVADETQQRLQRVVQRLSPTQREVFTLRVAEGLSYKEIADAVGTTEGAARVHYHNAMRAVKEFLDE
jgi:RNA polymerase sigma-70 factor (ECF subfamily)